jgi:Flp pilus assembly protein TadB
MNIMAIVTAALTAAAEFFGWKREEAKGDKSRVETLEKSQQSLEVKQEANRLERKLLDDDLKAEPKKRDHLGGDW